MVIDFQDPRLQVPVNQQIEAKYLERLARHCLFVCQCRHLLLDQWTIDLHSLRTRVRDTVLDFLHINSLLCKRLVKRLQRALRTIVFYKNIFGVRVHVRVVCLVNRVVRQVHKGLLEVGLGWCLVTRRTKASKAFFVDKC